MNNDKKSAQKLIVIIEDEKILSNLLRKRLQKAGYLVETADNGKTGVDLICKVKPDLVLLDIVLPQMDGFGVLEELKTKGLLPDLPIIVISNSGQPVEVERILGFGVRDYLVKINFSPHEVLEKVRRLFGS